jgi:hypothetical protein
MKEVGSCLRNLAHLLQSTIIITPCNTTEGNIILVVASCNTTFDIDHHVDDLVLLRSLLASSVGHK